MHGQLARNRPCSHIFDSGNFRVSNLAMVEIWKRKPTPDSSHSLVDIRFGDAGETRVLQSFLALRTFSRYARNRSCRLFFIRYFAQFLTQSKHPSSQSAPLHFFSAASYHCNQTVAVTENYSAKTIAAGKGDDTLFVWKNNLIQWETS